jgi:dTDP-4-amino-4,6-dideoxygalactose transaminase
VFGGAQGRSVFQLGLEALGMEKGKEIIFPMFTFPVMPVVAKLLGYKAVFCGVDPETYNLRPGDVEKKITGNTGAVMATHLFGQPCPIEEVAQLAKKHNIHLLEDCAHACGVRVNGKQVGTFGDIGVFSFAQGKNMPCMGGGAIATNSDEIAERAKEILKTAHIADGSAIVKEGASIWVKWLVTRPLIFGLTAYQALKRNLKQGKGLMDSAMGDKLVDKYLASDPKVSRMANLQGAIGRLQLKHIDAFNEGARRNALILTEKLGEVPGIRAPKALEGENIYVYYPITVDADKRDDLRNYLLLNGIDTKKTDMADCAKLKPFLDETGGGTDGPSEAALLEICVYPVLSEGQMKRIAKVIRAWANLPEL